MNLKQLKSSILQWAVEGKLVKQNLKDESVESLLKKIEKIKEIRIKEGIVKKTKNATISEDKCPYECPKGWKWVKVNDIAFVTKLAGFEYTNYIAENLQSSGVPLFKGKNVQNGKVVYKFEAFIAESVSEKLKRSQINRKCLLTPYVGTIGNIAIHDKKGLFHLGSNVGKIEFFNDDDNVNVMEEFALYYLQSPYGIGELTKYKKATAQESISIDAIREVYFPLPPLAEQKRIVAKLEQIMPLAEEYGAAQEQLDKLNRELPEALKKSILQQAIQGKLVPQNPKDEPAQKLLERITAARSEANQPKGAKSKKSSPTSRIYCENGTWYEQIGNAEPKDISEDIPFEIPENWIWCRLNSICDYLHRGKSPSYSDKKILPVMAQKCNQWDRIYTEKCLFADPKTIDRYLPEHFLQMGDVLINSTGGGTVGRTGYVDEYVFSEYDKFVADSHVTVVRSNKNICSKYVYYFLITPLIQTGIEERCSGSTNQIELGTETIKNYLIPLPPLAEQKRIVTKLEQLFKVL